MGYEAVAGRDVLPIPDIPPAGLTTYDAKDADTTYPLIEPFGGPCRTPNFERLAANGLKYTRFHTTALCSPTRSALLTGRNHHSVGMGKHRGPVGQDPAAQWVQHRPVRQVP
jgi:arylsulfatase A-like enzyme